MSSSRLHVQSVEELHRASLRRRVPVCPLSTSHHHHRPVSFLWKERLARPSALPSELPGSPQSLSRLGGWPILFSVYSTAGKSWTSFWVFISTDLKCPRLWPLLRPPSQILTSDFIHQSAIFWWITHYVMLCEDVFRQFSLSKGNPTRMFQPYKAISWGCCLCIRFQIGMWPDSLALHH